MEHVALGDSGIVVSKLCLGTGTIVRREGWGPEDAGVTIDLIRSVLDRGCNFVDTAQSYRTEELVGKAIKGRRDQVVVSTKIGHCPPVERTISLRGLILENEKPVPPPFLWIRVAFLTASRIFSS